MLSAVGLTPQKKICQEKKIIGAEGVKAILSRILF
jgi:hypothetical protein